MTDGKRHFVISKTQRRSLAGEFSIPRPMHPPCPSQRSTWERPPGGPPLQGRPQPHRQYRSQDTWNAVFAQGGWRREVLQILSGRWRLAGMMALETKQPAPSFSAGVIWSKVGTLPEPLPFLNKTVMAWVPASNTTLCNLLRTQQVPTVVQLRVCPSVSLPQLVGDLNLQIKIHKGSTFSWGKWTAPCP